MEFSTLMCYCFKLFSCGTSTEGEAHLVEWNESIFGRILSSYYQSIVLFRQACIISGPTFLSQYFQMQADIRDLSATNVVGYSGCKDNTLDIPSLGKQPCIIINFTFRLSRAASYSKFVSRDMSKAEALLKVILSPVDSVADIYSALLPEGTPSEFQRILDLKVHESGC
ncbi:hypothetical protein L2E82_28575 [Cichorium intybus]|uniref:Uncharacterized protein n=1 Tax=Cichorium intybus TaxID=13427 RepID=A0ACB9CW65_CICIN|nr:hypothetical protein L2E82_28575 [Cichorium intybus]